MNSDNELEQSALKRSASPLFEPQDLVDDISGYGGNVKRPKLDHMADDEAGRPDGAALDATGKQLVLFNAPYPTPEPRADGTGEQQTPTDSTGYGDAITPLPAVMGFNDKRPRLAAYHPYVRILEDEMPKICCAFLTHYRNHKEKGYYNSVLDGVYLKILEVCNPKLKYPVPKAAAFIGPMGVGKSQLINALLDVPEIALTSDTDRGTNIVHEFTGVKPYQEALFVIDAIYYAPKQMRQRIQEYCEACFKLFQLLLKQQDEPDSVQDTDFQDAEDGADSAIETLFTVLYESEKDDFSSQEALGQWLKEQFDEGTTLGQVVNVFMESVTTFMADRGVRNGMESHNASSISELAEVDQCLSRPTKCVKAQRHPWPLLHKTVTHFDHDVLNQGVVLADTGGLGDRNQAVVKATKSYAHSAGTLFVVAPFLRCSDNADLNDQLKFADLARKMHTTRVILTKIDEKGKAIDKKSLPVAARDAIDASEKDILQLEQRKDFLAAEKTRLGQLQQWEEYQAVDKELDKLPERLQKEKNRLYQHKVLGRNARVAYDMRGKYRQIAHSKHAPDLQTHFTSATEYEKHQQNMVGDEAPRLDLAATGIPAIRKVLYAIPAKPNFDTLSSISTRVLPKLFEKVISITTKTPFQRHHEVRTAIKHTLDTQCQSVGDVLQSQLVATYTEHIAGRFNEHSTGTWLEQGKALFKTWESLHGATFHAFCRRQGKWKMASNQDQVCWNSQIQDILRTVLKGFFEEMTDDIKSLKANASTYVQDMIFQQLAHALEEKAFGNVANSDAFLESIEEEKDELMYGLSQDFATLLVVFDDVRNNCISSEGDEHSIVAEAMAPTYLGAAAVSAKDFPGRRVKTSDRFSGSKWKATTTTVAGAGTVKKISGAQAERLRRVRAKVAEAGPDSVFCNVVNEVKAVCENGIIKVWLKKVKERVKRTRDAIMEDFDNRYQVPTEPPVEGTEEIEKGLRKDAQEALKYLHGKGARMLEVARKWEEDNAK